MLFWTPAAWPSAPGLPQEGAGGALTNRPKLQGQRPGPARARLWPWPGNGGCCLGPSLEPSSGPAALPPASGLLPPTEPTAGRLPRSRSCQRPPRGRAEGTREENDKGCKTGAAWREPPGAAREGERPEAAVGGLGLGQRWATGGGGGRTRAASGGRRRV